MKRVAIRRARTVVRGAAAVMLCLALGPLSARAQDGERAGHLRLGVGGFFPGRDLPSRDTPWGLGQGRFDQSMAVFVDYSRSAAWGGFAGYALLAGAPVTVQWRIGANSLAGLAGAGVVGLQHSIGIGAGARLFVRGGFGTALYLLMAGSACIPEDPACIMSSVYSRNHFDRMTHAAGGLEVQLGEVKVSVEAGSFGSRFAVADESSRQQTTVVLLGVSW